MSEAIKNKGWSVVTAGLAINLALGVLYAWSIFKGAIKASIEKGGQAPSSGTSPRSTTPMRSAVSLLPLP